jgi:cytochrome c peroxidase
MARAGFLQDRSEVQTAAVREMLENGTHATIAEIAAAELSSPIIPRSRLTSIPSDIAALVTLKAEYKRPPPRPIDNQALVDLGRLLFWDPRASASGKTACVNCHLPNLGWAVTDPRSRNDSGKLTSRKSPTRQCQAGRRPCGAERPRTNLPC